MNAHTALPQKMKTTSNELMRRLMNTSQGLPDSDANMVEAVNRYMVKMRNSGYGEKYRWYTFVNTVRGYRRRVMEVEEGVRPLYRETKNGERERHMAKTSAFSKWFKKRANKEDTLKETEPKTIKRSPWNKKGPQKEEGDTREIEGVIFLPHSTNSALQRFLQAADDKVTKAFGMPRTRYMEKGGLTYRAMLVRKNPWLRLGGGGVRPSCHICMIQEGKGTMCRREGTVYRVECKLCERGEGIVGRVKTKTWYIGETSRSCYERLKEHMWLFTHKKDGDPEKGEASSVFWKYSRDAHGGVMQEEDWSSKVTSTHFTALSRQLAEAVQIAEGKGG